MTPERQISLPLKKLRPKFHAARLEGSPRLQRVLRFLYDCRPFENATGREIAKACEVLNPGGCVSELNTSLNGFSIDCQPDGMSENGRKVYRYYLRWNERLERWMKERGKGT